MTACTRAHRVSALLREGMLNYLTAGNFTLLQLLQGAEHVPVKDRHTPLQFTQKDSPSSAHTWPLGPGAQQQKAVVPSQLTRDSFLLHLHSPFED